MSGGDRKKKSLLQGVELKKIDYFVLLLSVGRLRKEDERTSENWKVPADVNEENMLIDLKGSNKRNHGN